MSVQVRVGRKSQTMLVEELGSETGKGKKPIKGVILASYYCGHLNLIFGALGEGVEQPRRDSNLCSRAHQPLPRELTFITLSLSCTQAGQMSLGRKQPLGKTSQIFAVNSLGQQAGG